MFAQSTGRASATSEGALATDGRCSSLPEGGRDLQIGKREVGSARVMDDIARRLQVPERMVRYHLRQMTEGRVVEQVGTARKTSRYRLPFRQVVERQKESGAGVTTAKHG